MTAILGISAYYHDAAAALLRDGEIEAAAQEERFSRRKNDPRFPVNAINYCLGEGAIEPASLDAIVFYDNPLISLDRTIKNFLAVAPRGKDEWVSALTATFGAKARLKEDLRRTLGIEPPLYFVDHHLAHAAAAYFPSPFEHAAIVTADGVGEWSTTSIACGRGTDVAILKEINYPHSLGLLYSAVTYFCGFKVNSGEYKLMGLAPYGEPRFEKVIREKLIDVRDDGSFRLNTDYFGFLDGPTMTNDNFHSLFGGPPRTRESRITRREIDLAASIQRITEDVMLKLARTARAATGAPNLALAGGVALNCVANGKIANANLFDRIWIQPASGDAGSAVGAAYLAHHLLFGEPRAPSVKGRDRQKGSLLGPRYSTAEIGAAIERLGASATRVPVVAERHKLIARALADGEIVGFFTGRMEFGPRALGARSILGDSRRADAQSRMNLKIKFRESFRPFAPAVIGDRASEYFDVNQESPYMLLVAPVKPSRRRSDSQTNLMPADDDLIPVVNAVRSDIPAVTHVDYSARIQTVSAADNPEFFNLLTAFDQETGCPVLINTSFNVRGEPIVCSPDEAYRCFMRTDMDLLVLEDYLLWKTDQPPLEAKDNWRKQYELD